MGYERMDISMVGQGGAELIHQVKITKKPKHLVEGRDWEVLSKYASGQIAWKRGDAAAGL